MWQIHLLAHLVMFHLTEMVFQILLQVFDLFILCRNRIYD
jgi:hypothetical protein